MSGKLGFLWATCLTPLIAGVAWAQPALPPPAPPAPASATAQPSTPETMAQTPSPTAQGESTGAGHQLEEIVVTARRRSEEAQKVPASVTAFTPATLTKYSVTTVADISRLTPSLTVTESPYGPLGAFVAIRGQQVQDQQLDLSQSVGVYIDDVYQGSSSSIGALTTDDAASVEVLKGPQGTLYGRNTTGGAIKITTPLPNLTEFHGAALAGGGNFGESKFSADVTGPIVTDKAALRVSVNQTESSGFGDNVEIGDRLGSYNTTSGRVALRLEPTNNIEVVLHGDLLSGSAGAPVNHLTYVTPGGPLNLSAAAQLGLPLTPAGIGQAYQYLQNSVNRTGDTQDYSATNRQNVNTKTGSGAVTWHIAPYLNLKSITSYQHVNSTNYCDQDSSPIVAVEGLCSQQRFHQFTEELQALGDIGKLNYTLGYFHYDLDGTDYASANLFEALTQTINFNDSTVADKSDSGYAQLRYTVIPRIRLNGGIRYTSETVTATVRNRLNVAGQDLCDVPTVDRTGAACSATFPNTFNNISYQGGIDADLARDVLVYADTARGFKAGGVNLRVGSTGTLSSFAPEIATNYEIGLKSEYLNHTVRLNLAAFYTDYKNIQRTVVVLDNEGNSSTEVRNAAAASIKGLEGELTVNPISGLTVLASASYLDAKYSKYIVPATGQDISGNRFPNLPTWQASLAATYSTPTPAGVLTASSNLSYQSSVDFAPDSHLPASALLPEGTAPFTTQGGYVLLNARLALAVTRNVDLAFWGRNLTSKSYWIEAQDGSAATGFARALNGTPRTYGGEISYHF